MNVAAAAHKKSQCIESSKYFKCLTTNFEEMQLLSLVKPQRGTFTAFIDSTLVSRNRDWTVVKIRMPFNVRVIGPWKS